jgi:hypothetical protein
MPGRATNDPANYIALGKQTAKDVEATTFYYLKHLDGSGFDIDPDIGSERTGGDGQEIGFTYRQMVKADGNLVSYAWPEWVGRALAAVLGQDTPSLIVSPLTDHTLVPVASLPYFTVEQKWADINERNTNCKVTSVDIEFEAGKPIKVSAAIVGGGTVWIPTAVLTPARESGDPLMYPLSSIALTGMATGLKVTKGKISIKRGVDDGIQTVGIAREDVVELNQDYQLDLTCKYEDSLMYKNALFNGGTAVISDLATMGFSLFQAVGSQSMRIDMPLLEISGFKVNRLDPDGKTMYGDLAAQSVKAATVPLWARVRNLATAGF